MPENQVRDRDVIHMLWKVVTQIRARGEELSLECLLTEEKAIHIGILCSSKGTTSGLPFNLAEEIELFVRKVNQITMECFKSDTDNLNIKLMGKAIDIIQHPAISCHIESLAKLGRLKVFTFNNLACIYKKKKKFRLALRAVSHALLIEEYMLNNDINEEKYDIIPTYLNKAAILSDMKQHEKAIEEIMKAKRLIEAIEREATTQIEETRDEEINKRLMEKQHYGLYMKMIIYYNMGAQKEHLKMISNAREFYLKGRDVALKINNVTMLKKFNCILESFRYSQ